MTYKSSSVAVIKLAVMKGMGEERRATASDLNISRHTSRFVVDP